MRYSLVPVGQGHHDVEGGQEQREMEEGVAVCDAVLFVIHSASHAVLRDVLAGISGRQPLNFLCLHQLIHLAVV